MAIVDLVMPKMGESITEATILKWHKQPGDHVKMDETILEIATDKVDTEVPSTVAGTIEQILYNVNDVVPVGSVIAKIKTEVEEKASGKPADEEQEAGYAMQDTFQEKREHTSNFSQAVLSDKSLQGSPLGQISHNNGRFYSPLVLNIAASEGVSMSEL